MRILLVEDDRLTRVMLQRTLEKAGHQVLLASQGAEAWEALAAFPAQVIVSDWTMPELDGLELCQRVRQRRVKEYVYFIMLTARSEDSDYQLAMEAGVDDFLTKPLREDELLIRLRVADRILSFMGQVRELRRLLPICSYCKKIRDDRDYWHQIENFMHAQTGADFSHSVCPDCFERVVKPQLQAEEAKPTSRKIS